MILNAYAHDTTWRKGQTADDDFGPPALFRVGRYQRRRRTIRPFNLAYWQHYDRVIDAMHRRGIARHMSDEGLQQDR